MIEQLYNLNNILHSVIGSVAILGGLVALFSIKGSDKHKLAGKIFSWFIILSAATSFIPIAYKFKEIGPLAMLMALATIYLVITAIIAIRYQESNSPLIEKLLIIIPLVLAVLPLIRTAVAIKNGNYDIFIGPILLGSLFLYLFITDISILRNRQRSKEFWIKRHFTRMMFAFAFGMMAFLRIGVDFGLSFEMTVVLPLLAALLIVIYFRKRSPF